ncbi:MAG TPA: UTP--glucose-1-phosphate uridylyltransferase [Solirubrobacteraceae bacterium]|nr:UTP--glucose-1-phosphate uridylyltransferase [Solirubrobacteraceae bacterium]
MSAEGLRASEEKMHEGGVPDVAIDTFRHYYRQLEDGETGLMPEAELDPLGDVPTYDDLPEDRDAMRSAVDRAVVIKLNGGLGTSMGMTRAKSLLEVKDGLTFLDVIVGQVLHLREAFGARLPLVLMNSFSTQDATREALERHPGLRADVPLDFVQHKEPKLLVDGLTPARWSADPGLEWAPPGHGDLYTALVTSGTLRALLDAGYDHAFVSNSDNLGATLEPRILAWMREQEIPFLSEVVDRTEADKKGGHLARRKRDGQIVLREAAQVADADQDAFQDVTRHAYFNANNLWMHLPTLQRVLDERDNVLGLPLIRNEKTVDPGDKSSPAVYQLETAMGAAVGVIPGAGALHVPRARFVPVKTTNDLLVLRSDVYVLTDDARVVEAPERSGTAIYVDLDPDFYKLLRDFEARFAGGPPSLVACERLVVRGDVTFGRDVVCRGEVELRTPEPMTVDDGTVLEG